MSVRAGILVTGTEVLSGRVRDRNGPWLADRLAELGVELAYVTIVGDRPEDMTDALRFMAERAIALVLTSGGLGPTADDLTTEIVARFHGVPLELDPDLERRIGEIVAPLAARFPQLDRDALATGTRKQAHVPRGATVLAPIGTAPGFVLPGKPGAAAGPKPGGPARLPTVVVLPGPPRELQPMWSAAVQTDALRAAIADAGSFEQRTLRLFGIPESEIAETLREAGRKGVELERLEITTCLKRGEIEIVTRYEPGGASAYEAFARVVAERHPDTLFSTDGSTVDRQVAALLLGGGSAARAEPAAGDRSAVPAANGDGRARAPLSIAVAESCTGGELCARLTAPPGASTYVKGGVVAYANEVKAGLVGVQERLLAEHGAVSQEVAEALADGARARMCADVGVGITGVAGPGGGSDEKPVGLVWLSVAGPGGARLTRSVNLPGGRADVRDRATTVALHLIRRLLSELR